MGFRSWLFSVAEARQPRHDLWENEIPATMAEDHTSMLRFAAREPMGRLFVMEVRADAARAAINACLGIDPPKQDR